VEFQVRKAPRVDVCYFSFGIYRAMREGRWRVYQVEVYPSERRSHRGADGHFLNGPHEHWGEEASAIDDPDVGCHNWRSSLDAFLRRCPITGLQVDTP
jgi:hypothetical protein